MPFLLPAEPIISLDDYVDHWEGGQGLVRCRELGAEGVVDELARSGLRGRGGAGFPAGTKWASVRSGGAEAGDRYVVANGAEGEPGTFKDRMLMRRNPYQVVEGLAIAAATIGARHGYLALKASFLPEIEAITRAVREMSEAGLLGDVPVTLVTGPEEYLFGEEKALLEVVEGEDPLPRVFPPYLYGLFTNSPQLGWSAGVDTTAEGPAGGASNPTLVTNVETLANVVPILGRGADWHQGLGTAQSPGVVLCTVSGDTNRAGVAEIELGTPLGEVIERVGGGMPEGRRVQAVLSGVSNGVVTGDDLDAAVSYEGLEAVGGGLGSAGFIVYDDTRDLIDVARAMSRFLFVESCGQCPACKFGTGEVTAGLERILAGEGSDHDVAVIGARLDTVTDGNRCYLPVQEQLVVRSILARFADRLEAHVHGQAAPPEPVPIPKLVDIRDGIAVHDELQQRKQPDWTYAAADPDR